MKNLVAAFLVLASILLMVVYLPLQTESKALFQVEVSPHVKVLEGTSVIIPKSQEKLQTSPGFLLHEKLRAPLGIS